MTQIVAYKSAGLCGEFANSVSPAHTSLSPTELMDWLVFSHTTTTTDCLKVVWDLGEFVTTVLSRLPESIRTELQSKRRIQWNNYRFYYIPDKVFSVNKDGSESSFYDLSQYYPGSPEPRSLPELQLLADELLATLAKLGIPSPTTLSSPVAAFKGSERLNGYPTVPTVFDAPESLLEAYNLALQCTPREWVVNYQIGHFPELYSCDLSSAYPYHASQLLDLRDCSFHKSTELDLSAYYGFLVGDFTVYPDHPLAFCSPFLADRGDGALVNFTGTIKDYPCLLDEVRVLNRYEMGEFRIKQGWYIKPLSGVRPKCPFQSLMFDLYQSRYQSELASYILKRVMNGIVGKLLETRKDKDGNITEYGDIFNPVYHSICTTRTRLQVFEFLTQQGVTRDELVFIGVDGVKTTRCIPLPDQVPMGRWRSAGSEPTFILSPGAVITPHRNFKRTGYNELLIQLCKYPLSSAFGKDGDIDLRKLFLSQTRVFPEFPRTGQALLSGKYLSEAIVL